MKDFSRKKIIFIFITGVLLVGFFLPNVIYRAPLLPQVWDEMELIALLFRWMIFSGVLTILLLPIVVFFIQSHLANFSKRSIGVSLLPIGVILLFGLSMMIQGKPSSCFSPFSFFGFNPTFSILVTDEILDDAYRIDSLLTASRLSGNEIALGDYSIGMNECQDAVKVKWKNFSSQQIVINELPEKDEILIRPNQSASYTFSSEGDYPYTLNGYPKIIHAGAAGSSRPPHQVDLKAFCHRFAKEEAEIIFLGEIQKDELGDLLSAAHLEFKRKDPYYMVLVKVLPGFDRERDIRVLQDHPKFGSIIFDCSFEESF